MHRELPAILVAALFAFLAAPGASGDGEPAPQIVDPPLDPTARPEWLIFGVTEPSTDLRSVRFSRAEDDLVVRFEVTSLEFAETYPLPPERQVTAIFASERHDHVYVYAFEQDARWHSFLLCTRGSAFTCAQYLGPPEVDNAASAVTIRAPLSPIGGRVIDPIAIATMDFEGCDCRMLKPTFGIHDYAPNLGAGDDFDPYAP